METRRGAPLELRNGHYPFVLAQYVGHAVSHGRCTFERCSGRHVYLNGKLITVGRRHHLLRETAYKHGSDDDTGKTCKQRNLRMGETCVEQFVITAL